MGEVCLAQHEIAFPFAERVGVTDLGARHQHKGAEIIYVLTGQLVVNVDSDETMLGEGDAMYFDSSFPHS
jgi:uncharacterized cupin superfamily protein